MLKFEFKTYKSDHYRKVATDLIKFYEHLTNKKQHNSCVAGTVVYIVRIF